MKFKYHNDTIIFSILMWLGNLIRLQKAPINVYRSTSYEFEFATFRDYWTEVGKRGALVHFISSKVPGKYGPKYYTTMEVGQRLARLDLGTLPGIVITSIDQYKLDRLMYMFAGVSPEVFRNADFAIFPTKNKEAARKLTQAIPIDLAEVHGFADGYIFCDNYDTE